MRVVVGVRRRRRRLALRCFLLSSAFSTLVGLLLLSSSRSDDLPLKAAVVAKVADTTTRSDVGGNKTCATVEEMGEVFRGGSLKEALRLRRIIQNHFAINGAPRVRKLSPKEFCRHGFVLGKASEAGFGNEMYKILTGAALSVMLNRSLIIGQTRGRFPFGEFISYSDVGFTMNEIKHLWRQNGCLTKYGRHLVIRIDDFLKPIQTNVLCSNYRRWKQPIICIRLQNTTDAMAAQFFLKNIHDDMRIAATDLFGRSEDLHNRPNVFGELMRVLISPSEVVQRAVQSVLKGDADPDIALHMRMLTNRSVRAVRAALGCIKKAAGNLKLSPKPRVVVVSDTPSLVKDIAPYLNEFAEVLHFDYKHFDGAQKARGKINNLNFRSKDWGPAPRWVAFVDFFLASRAKHAVISGAHRRVGTTYAQLIAALGAAYHLDNSSSFSFLSSFQRNLVYDGLRRNQMGWGHVWNRFAGPLSCHSQSNQCAYTPLLPPAWWDGIWQSPISRDIRRMEAYGIRLSAFGTFDVNQLRTFCNSRKDTVVTKKLII
ncbi:uncharacterized protein LOC116013360 isoform X2 [Ipomoea triloba]|uniref:uncharacterized protein LOC116013360 isoform X2 n=1 Tax=Ipomoea triloba TaxID=35885 RepID=UPI00125DC27E|nr:uncharacterized protein LOC116013360 isoform X2 [Ipomoea triloba]